MVTQHQHFFNLIHQLFKTIGLNSVVHLVKMSEINAKSQKVNKVLVVQKPGNPGFKVLIFLFIKAHY